MNKKTKKIIIYSLNLLIYFGLFKIAFASDYVLLESLPGITVVKTNGFGLYLSKIFKLSINIALVLAVFQLSFAGFKYLTEESFSKVSDAKKRIQNAITGLVIILAAYLVLQTINPELVGNNAGIPPAITNPSYMTTNTNSNASNNGNVYINTLSSGDKKNSGAYYSPNNTPVKGGVVN